MSLLPSSGHAAEKPTHCREVNYILFSHLFVLSVSVAQTTDTDQVTKLIWKKQHFPLPISTIVEEENLISSITSQQDTSLDSSWFYKPHFITSKKLGMFLRINGVKNIATDHQSCSTS